ncbi:hypothetical protein MHYP_G00170300 [Metynnis hypsauchen]
MKLLLLMSLLIYSLVHTAQTADESFTPPDDCCSSVNFTDDDSQEEDEADETQPAEEIESTTKETTLISTSSTSTSTKKQIIVSQSGIEGSNVALACGNEGKVLWSKGTDGGTSTILTAEDGEITQRYRPDPENRYSVLTKDLSLVIRSVSLSDSGIYYCNTDHAVNLTVNPAPPTADKGPHTTSSDVSSDSPVSHTSTASPTTTASTVSPTTTEASPSFSTKGFFISIAVLVGVLLIVLALFLQRRCFKRKAARATKTDNVYEIVNDEAASTQPASSPPKEYEAIYVLAGDPDVIKLGLKNQSAASPLKPPAQSSENNLGSETSVGVYKAQLTV